jgi:hypothetical protein
MKTKILRNIFLNVGVLFASVQLLPAGTITTFDPPGSTFTAPRSITPGGVIIGSYVDASGVTHGFLRARDGSITSFDVPGSTFTTPTSITPGGVIIGWYGDASGGDHGFLRARDGSITSFDAPPGGFIVGSFYTIFAPPPSVNPAGSIAGTYVDASFVEHGSEIEFEGAALEHVVVGIDAGLAAIETQIGDPEWYDGEHALDDAEPLLGLGFVAFQRHALRAVQDLNRIRASHGKPKRDKRDCCSCDPITIKEGMTRIQLVNAVANYFKHHDEWTPRWPIRGERGFSDTQILARVGITQKTVHPCIEATNLLCGTSWKIIVIHQIVHEWREHLINELG